MTARKNQTPSLRFLRWYFGLPALAAVLAISLVFAAPSEGGSAWLLGLSTARWALVLLLLAAAGVFAWLFVQSRNQKPTWRKAIDRVIPWLRQPGIAGVLALGLMVIGTVAAYLCILAFKFQDEFVTARLQRLLPLLLFIVLLCMHNLIALALVRMDATEAPTRPRFIIIAGFAFLLGCIALVIGQTRLGLAPDRIGWDNPGVPLLATQIFSAWCLASLVLFIFALAGNRWPKANLDWVVCLTLWLITVVAWQSQPLTPTFFSPRPVAPTYEYFPYSDAATHDLVAQNLMIGEGFSPAAEKPLYSFFLAGLHTFLGQDYVAVVNAQIMVLALLPLVVYLLAKKMHHRFSGVLLALLVILRERNTIALSGEIGVSHSKLLMTDLPTALALAAFSLLALYWLNADRRALRWPLFVGSALGAVTLLRSQNLIFLPVFILLALTTVADSWRSKVRYSLVLLLGFLAVALPWMVRNGIESGQFGFSQPLQGLYLAKQYSLTPEANDPGFPVDTPPASYARLGFASAMRFARAHPVLVAQFITAHFLHNEVSSFLALPMRFDLADKLVTFYNLHPYWIGLEGRLWSECCSLYTYVEQTPYWSNWQGVFPAQARLPIVFNLAAIAIGLATATRRLGWAGLLPAAVHLIYNFSTAIARVSGWRLNLPVDWVLLLYYAMGIGQLTLWIWAVFTAREQKRSVKAAKKPSEKRGWQAEGLSRALALLLLAGLTMPAAEWVIPQHYQRISKNQAVQVAVPLRGFDVNAFLAQPGAQVINGRALWPRFYLADQGEPGGQWPAFNPLPFARLGFVLIGPQGAQVVLPLLEAPQGFENGADLVVYGCPRADYFEAVAVVASDVGWIGEPANQACE